MLEQKKIKQNKIKPQRSFNIYILLMVLAILMSFISPSFSYFSDEEKTSGSIQAATLDFSAPSPFYITMTPLIDYSNPVNLTNLGSIDDFKYYSQVEGASGDLCELLEIRSNEDDSFFYPLIGYVSPTSIFSEKPSINTAFHLDSGSGTCSFYLRITANQVDCFPGFSDEELVYFEIIAKEGTTSINVDKTSDKSNVLSGETVVYTYTVTNTGDFPLQDVTINDDYCSPISGPTGDLNENTILEKEETWIYTCSAQLTQTTTNTVIVSGVNEFQVSVIDTDQLTVTVGTEGSQCTLTQGYWKNHDWPEVTGMPEWFTVKTLKTPVANNAWYQLAYQYIAAVLNGLNGAPIPTEIQKTIDEAAILLTDTIFEVSNKEKEPFITAARILTNYNEGLAGVPHCTD